MVAAQCDHRRRRGVCTAWCLVGRRRRAGRTHLEPPASAERHRHPQRVAGGRRDHGARRPARHHAHPDSIRPWPPPFPCQGGGADGRSCVGVVVLRSRTSCCLPSDTKAHVVFAGSEKRWSSSTSVRRHHRNLAAVAVHRRGAAEAVDPNTSVRRVRPPRARVGHGVGRVQGGRRVRRGPASVEPPAVREGCKGHADPRAAGMARRACDPRGSSARNHPHAWDAMVSRAGNPERRNCVPAGPLSHFFCWNAISR